MLSLPDEGVRLSVKEHNSDLSVLCDWVEASVLLGTETVSTIDLVDILMEEQVYREQDFAHEIIEQVRTVVSRRQNWLSASRAVSIEGARFVRALDWRQVPAHAFCLIVALRRCFKTWSRDLGPNYVDQGRLFEWVTAESLTRGGWKVFRTGWAGLNTPPAFVGVVTQIANLLNEPATLDLGISRQVKDQGLDLLCYRPFADRRGGHILFLVQCASGDNWTGKLRTPSENTWRDLVRFSSPYPRAIAVPFAFPDDNTFREVRKSADGIFLDRFRILEAGVNA